MKTICIFLLMIIIGISLLILPLFAIMPHQTKEKSKEDVKAIKDISSISKMGIALVVIGGIGFIGIFVCYAIFGIERFDSLFNQYLRPIIYGFILLIALISLIVMKIKEGRKNK